MVFWVGGGDYVCALDGLGVEAEDVCWKLTLEGGVVLYGKRGGERDYRR